MTTLQPGRQGEAPAGPAFRYDAFISYSSADRTGAKALHRQLENYDRPFYRWQRTMKVFLDEASMSAHPDLSKTLEDNLAASRFLVVLASPEAAESPWVRDELLWWKANRSPDQVLVGYTAGEVDWDDAARMSPLLPRAVGGLFAQQPRWVDLRFLRDQERGRRDIRLPERAAEFVAPIQDKEKQDVFADYLRRQRSLRRWQVTAIIALLAIVVLLTGITVYALRQRDTASRETMAAQSRQLTVQAQSIADDQPELARQLLVEAWRLDRTGPVVGAVLQAPMLPRVITVEGAPRDVDFLPDGRAMIVTSRDRVTFHDPGTTKIIGELAMAGSWAGQAAVSPDGRLLAVAREGGVDLFAVAAPREPKGVGSIEIGGGLQTVTFDRTGKRLYAIVSGGGIFMIDVSEPGAPAVVRRLAGTYENSGAPEALTGIAADPDGGVLLSQGGAGETRVWSPPAEHKSLPADGQVIAFTRRGHLAATGGTTDRLVRLWDLADPAAPQLRAVVAGQDVAALAFATDGKTLAVGTGDGTVQLYDVADPLRVRAGALLAGQTEAINNVTFSPSGRTLATVSQSVTGTGSVRLWQLTGSQRSAALAELPPTGTGGTAFSPDGRLLSAGLPRAVWDLTEPSHPVKRMTQPSNGRGSHAAAFGADGKTLVTSLPPVVFDITGDQPRLLTTASPPEDDSNVQIVFQPGREVVAVAEQLGEAELWDVSHPEEPRRIGPLPGSEGQPQGLTFRPDGAFLATVGSEGEVFLWDVAAGSIRPAGAMKVPTLAKSVAWGVDAGLLYVGDGDGSITVWNVADSRHPRQTGIYKRHIGGVSGLALHPGGHLLASASDDGSVRLWEAGAEGRLSEAAVLADDRPTMLSSLVFSPRGDLLAGGGQLWSVDDDAAVARLCAESSRITPDQWKQYLPARPYDPPCR